ncbi:monovalent cation/H+ antiporter subunit D [Alginatibacterium sediminis]|uniref:Monovalent cation/H+ antiporter subunit D n=1 Tax=Alginatibacterium sediminis TaxID=2164068 RepID=A0A420EI40_9ALTE|nr:monovalent cation/H+ antiporter subunit D [Alginatibacterium sediminis]RKF20382.1 monovalent cation/H+ antiporter subunit D [Alginatibacterium sediminis]
MLQDHLAILPIITPMLMGIILLFARLRENINDQRVIAICGQAIGLLISIVLLRSVLLDGPIVYQLGNWQQPYGIALYVDQLSALLVLLTSLVAFCAQAYSCAGEDKNGAFFHPLMMFQVAGISGAFLTADIFNLFVFFEILLMASYSLMIHGGGKNKVLANSHYVFLNLLGSSIFLIALGTIYAAFGTLSYADLSLKAQNIEGTQLLLAQAGIFLLFVVFALKSAMLPLHLWLAKTYSSTSAPVAALFAILTKVGLYCIWRIHGVVFGSGVDPLSAPVLQWLTPLALLTLALAAVGILGSKTLRQLASYLIIASVGSLLLVIAQHNPQASAAGFYYLIHSTLAGCAIFLLAGIVVRLRAKAQDRFVSTRAMPSSGLLSFLFLVIAIAMIGLPPLSGFIGKALLLKATMSSNWMVWSWALILISSFVSLIAMSRAASYLFWKASGEPAEGDVVHKLELIPLFVISMLLLALVVFANDVDGFTQSAAQQMHAYPMPEMIGLKGAQ